MGLGRRRALVAGWFSFEEVVATVGDELGCDATARWLRDAGWQVDTAFAPYLDRGVFWREANPSDYDLLVFTTGPLAGELPGRLLDRFRDVPAWAVNVSVLDAAVAGRFARIWARDDETLCRPDLALAEPVPSVPLLAVAYAGAQTEYPHGRQEQTAALLRDWLESRQHAVAEIDTDLYAHHRWARRPAQAVALIARCDAVVTMRLHGLVLALANGVPALAVDGVAPGGKVLRQARALGWPHVVTAADEPDFASLDALLADCLTEKARARARSCRDRAAAVLTDVGREFAAALADVPPTRCAGPSSAGPSAASQA